LTTVYFDTPDQYFRRHEAALRVAVGRIWIQTLKAEGRATSGLHQRENGKAASRSRNLISIPAALLAPDSRWSKRLARDDLQQRLIPVCDEIQAHDLGPANRRATRSAVLDNGNIEAMREPSH
jgi:inorganic triphosphatase YgiF